MFCLVFKYLEILFLDELHYGWRIYPVLFQILEIFGGGFKADPMEYFGKTLKNLKLKK